MISLFASALLIGPTASAPADAGVPDAGCHALIAAACETLRAEEALRCRNEADAQCDIADAEWFIAAGDVKDAESRIDQACAKYEDQLNMMLPDVEPGSIAEAMIRYAGASSSIFALLAREGEVEDLTRAVIRLEKSRTYLSEVLERRDDLARNPDLRAAVDDLTNRLTTALDQLARRQMKRADDRFKAVGRGDGGAMSYYHQAAVHAGKSFALAARFAYKVTELDAKLAQADLHAVLAREERVEVARACQAYRNLRRELVTLNERIPDAQKQRYASTLADFAERAERGARACTANARIAAGAALLGVGAAGLGVAIGLYSQYTSACEFGLNEVNGKRECLGIHLDGGETDRYTSQIRASIGLAVAGGAVFAAGAAIMIPGLVQRKRARPRRFHFTPSVGPRHAGALLRLEF